jgi:hypothetical protein
MRQFYSAASDKLTLAGWRGDETSPGLPYTRYELRQAPPALLEFTSVRYIRLPHCLGNEVQFDLGTWDDTESYQPPASEREKLIVVTLTSPNSRYCIVCADVTLQRECERQIPCG